MTPRASNDRRSGHDRRSLTPAERQCLAICRRARVVFIGVQEGFGRVPAQLLFQRDSKTTTLAVPAEGATPEAIQERLAGHRLMEYVFFERHYPPTRHHQPAARTA